MEVMKQCQQCIFRQTEDTASMKRLQGGSGRGSMESGQVGQ